MSQLRLRYVTLALVTIVLGLLVHLRGSVLSPNVRDILGDALWAAMIYWWIGALMPGTRLATRTIIAYAICAAVEVSQLYHTPSLDALRATRLGGLVLGSGFDPRDLLAYAIGVLAAARLEIALAARRRRQRGSTYEPHHDTP